MEQYNEISMDGFKVVSSDFFCTVSRVSAPTITVWDGSIGFSKQDLLLLNSCENVLMQINAENKRAEILMKAIEANCGPETDTPGAIKCTGTKK